MRSILLLSDSVNRRFLRMYNEKGVRLPNLERLADMSVTFENHWTASAPCMPARRDIMTGRVNFLERNWGPIEAFDFTLPQALGKGGVASHMVTDHYHYFEIGGENYCQMFDSWELVRGQEWDPCVSRLGQKEVPEHKGKMVPQYWYNREQWKGDEEKYPSAQVLTKAAQWLEEHHDCDDFFLWVEPFDPHEPFDVPEKYLELVGDSYEGLLCMWPEYKTIADAGLGKEEAAHLCKRYLALLYMTDVYLGKIFEVMDRYHMWEDTLFIYTTDHGYMLGEHDYMAKNYMPAFNEVFHIPLMVHLPGSRHAGERVQALTQNIDMMPTLMEFYGISSQVCRNPLHGKSLLPLMEGEVETVRDCALYGYFGKQMNITDGRYTYFRSPNRENRPLNLYTTMMTDIRVYFDYSGIPGDNCRISAPEKITGGQFLKWTPYPVLKVPADAITDFEDGTLRYVRLFDWEMEDQLYDLETDYEQEHNIIDSRPEVLLRMEEMMKGALKEHDAPEEQFVRLRFQEM